MSSPTAPLPDSPEKQPLIYRDYPLAELDLQYNARATVADVTPFLAAYRKHSDGAKTTIPCHLGVAYGPGADETLDIFPASSSSAPVFVYIHGGYWRLLGREDSSFMAPTFTRQGALVVAINYSLAPACTLDEIVRQNRAAIAWVYRHIHRYGGDPQRIHIAGSSAGGHLVGMLTARAWASDYGLPEDVIKGACALSGLFDLQPLLPTQINGWMHLDHAAAYRNSPLYHLPNQNIPLIISYGGNESAEFKRQSHAMEGAWLAHGYDCRYIPMPHCNHFDIVLELMKDDSPLTQAVWQQMGIARG